MPSFLARLRNRATSQSSKTQSSPLPRTEPTPEQTPEQTPDERVTPTPPFHPIDRRIRPDLNTLLETYAAQQVIPRKPDETTPVLEEGHTPLKPRVTSRFLIPKERYRKPSSTMLSPGRGRPLSPRLSQTAPLGGTFGRHSFDMLEFRPPPDSFNSLPTRHSSKREKENNGLHRAHSWRQVRPSTAPNSQVRLFRSLKTSKSSITQDQNTAARSLSPSNTTTPSSRSSKRRSAQISPIANQVGFDSPRTLGYPSPLNTRTPGSNINESSPSSQVPSLDYLELPSRPALPTSHTFGRSIRLYSSLPKVQKIFSTDSPPDSNRSSRRRAYTASSGSNKTSRRSSAEWCTGQAVSPNSESGPGDVSKELPFSESAGDQDPGNHDHERGSHMVTALTGSARDNGNEISVDTSSQTFPPSTHLPSSVGSPLFLEGADSLDFGGEGAEDREGMDNVSESSNSKSSGKRKTPLKSSLRTNPSVTRRSPRSRPDIPESMLSTPSASTKGKRKADQVDITPPDQRSVHAKFDIPEDDRSTRRTISDPRAPSSYRVKRARLSGTPTPSSSKHGSLSNAANTGSWGSQTSSRPPSRQQSLNHPPVTKEISRTTSRASNPASSDRVRSLGRRHSVSSLSHTSIPISALVTPHAPSLSKSLTTSYHIRDPRRPPKVQSTPWSLRFRSEEQDGSPLHAWFFFVGFVIFPVWWLASVWRIPQTRQVGGEDTEKAVTLDDPQVEHDARSWRLRCRIMSGLSIVTYIPFIVLVAIFVH